MHAALGVNFPNYASAIVGAKEITAAPVAAPAQSINVSRLSTLQVAKVAKLSATP
jgi:hypothetical protein